MLLKRVSSCPSSIRGRLAGVRPMLFCMCLQLRRGLGWIECTRTWPVGVAPTQLNVLPTQDSSCRSISSQGQGTILAGVSLLFFILTLARLRRPNMSNMPRPSEHFPITLLLQYLSAKLQIK